MAVAQGEEDKPGQTSARSAAATRLEARRKAKAAAKASKRGTAPLMPSKIGERVETARSWFDQHQRNLLIGLIAVLAITAAWPLVSAQFGKTHREAADLLGAALTTANAPIIAEGSEPADDAPAESYPTLQARADKTRAAFATAVKRFPDSPAAVWAKLGEANALSELGKTADAQRIYASLADRTELEPFVRFRALEGLGYTLAAQQKYADAAKRFAQIGELDKGAYKVAADYQQARMLIAQGSKQKAADMLQALVKAERARPATDATRFESVVTDAETLLTELSVELNSPKLRADIQPAKTPGAPGAPGAQDALGGSPHGGGNGLSQEIIDALRKQLASGKGDQGLTKDVVDQLEKQVKDGTSNSTTITVPAAKDPAAPATPPATKDAPR